MINTYVTYHKTLTWLHRVLHAATWHNVHRLHSNGLISDIGVISTKLRGCELRFTQSHTVSVQHMVSRVIEFHIVVTVIRLARRLQSAGKKYLLYDKISSLSHHVALQREHQGVLHHNRISRTVDGTLHPVKLSLGGILTIIQTHQQRHIITFINSNLLTRGAVSELQHLITHRHTFTGSGIHNLHTVSIKRYKRSLRLIPPAPRQNRKQEGCNKNMS